MTDATLNWLLTTHRMNYEFINMNAMYKVPQLAFLTTFSFATVFYIDLSSHSGLIVYPNHSDVVIPLCRLVPSGTVPSALLTFQIPSPL